MFIGTYCSSFYITGIKYGRKLPKIFKGTNEMNIENSLRFIEQPEFRDSVMIAGWFGWPDASQVATNALQEIIKQLKMEHFAHIEPDDFYVFSELRPLVTNLPSGKRTLKWPSNKFYYRKAAQKDENDLILLLGTEPHLQWQNYVDLCASLVNFCDTKLFIMAGALLSPVPHTRHPLVQGFTTHKNLGLGFENVRYKMPSYEGPAGIASVIMKNLDSIGIKTASIWGHAPEYLEARRNPLLTCEILREIGRFLPCELNFCELEEEAAEFSRSVENALADDKEIASYVHDLEERFDAEEDASMNSADIVEDLEEYLNSKSTFRKNDGEKE